MNIRHELITPEERVLIDRLLELRSKKQARNWLKTRYYEGKISVRSLMVSLPPELANMAKVVLGWGGKAVDAIVARSRFDGFVYEGLTDDPLTKALQVNNFYDLYRQATISELMNSCAFVTIGAGTEGEPDVVFNFYAATQAAAIWNAREKRIGAGLVITEFADNAFETGYGEPSAFVLHTDYAAIECVKENAIWDVRRVEHPYGRPLMEALVYKPTLTKPFGTSRINRAVMSIIDRAMRCAVRMDIAAEFFSVPQKYLLGAEKEVLEGRSKWEAYIGSIFGVSRDENGEMPVFGQLPQMQLTPLTDQFRALAAEFAGETCIPISSLGVIHDNPSSAEAIHAAREDLVLEAEGLNATNGNALKNVGLLALMILGGYTSVDAMPEEWKTITPKFKNPAKPSIVSQADALIKLASVFPWLGDTIVALEEAGFSRDQIIRMLAERTKGTAQGAFEKIVDEMGADNGTSQIS